RARLFASFDAACEHGTRTQRDKDLGQTDLFDGGEDGVSGSPGHSQLPDVPSWTEIEQLNYEKDALGLYRSGHPIDRYADDLREYGAKTTADLNVKKRDEGDLDESGAGAPPPGPTGGPEGAAPHSHGNGRNGRGGEEISIA